VPVGMYQRCFHWVHCREYEVGNFSEALSRKYKFLSNWIKILESLHEDINTLYCCWRNKFAVKVLCAALSILVLLTLTYSSTKQTERSVAFLLQQW
jgi:hypothetical protein